VAKVSAIENRSFLFSIGSSESRKKMEILGRGRILGMWWPDWKFWTEEQGITQAGREELGSAEEQKECQRTGSLGRTAGARVEKAKQTWGA
jgi:hypothetical protein